MNIEPYMFPLDDLHASVMAFVESDKFHEIIVLDQKFASKTAEIGSHYQVRLGDDFSVWTVCVVASTPHQHILHLRRNEPVN